MKPTASKKREQSVPSRRPAGRYAASDPRTEAEVRKAGGNDYKADLNPPKVTPRSSHSHPLMQGPGLSVPGISNPRRAGFQRKYKHKD